MRYGHRLVRQCSNHVALSVRPQVHNVSAQFNWPPEIQDAGWAENGDAVAIGGKRAPRFDLAGAFLSDFRVVDVVRTAQSCREGFWCWYDQDHEDGKRENNGAGVNPTLPRSHEARRRFDRCRHLHTTHPCHSLSENDTWPNHIISSLG